MHQVKHLLHRGLDMLASELEIAWTAIALEIQAVAAQEQVAAGHIQTPDGPQPEDAALAVLVQTAWFRLLVMWSTLARRPETPTTYLSS
ncbi:TPA: hypothetical protein ACH3X1_002906 [Trebouxia sp. C0004]